MFSSMLPSERSAKIVCSTCRKYEAKEKHSITAVYRVDVIVNGWWLLPVLVGAAVSQTIQMIFFFDVLCARRSFSFGSHCLAFRYCCLRWASCTLFVESTISLLFSIFVLSSTTMIRSPESRTVGFFGTRHKKKMNKRNFLLALKEEKRRTTRAKTRSKATQRLLKFYFWVQPGETDSKIPVVQKSTIYMHGYTTNFSGNSRFLWTSMTHKRPHSLIFPNTVYSNSKKFMICFRVSGSTIAKNK